MIQITIDDVTYTFIEHAETRMSALKITIEMVESVLLDPERMELSKSSSYTLYVKKLDEQKRPLQVVVDEEAQEIISAHWLEPLR